MKLPKRKGQTRAERLGKNLQTNKKNARVGRTRKSSVRKIARCNARGAVESKRDVPEIARLLGALRAKEIRFQLIGMSAAVLQGVPVTTIDIDLWIDLPVRQYMRPVNVALELGGALVRNTIVELRDGALVNFIYEVTGLKSFRAELKNAKEMSFHGEKVSVLPLESIQKSKRATMRPKDVAHLVYIAQALAVERLNAKNAAQENKK
jgi:hypothetical protein